MTGRYTTQVPMLVGRQFDNEVILASFETGLYYSLIGTAADIWLGLKAGATAETIAAAFARLGADGAADEVNGFIAKLLAEKIIAPCDDPGTCEAWSPQFSDPFSTPVLDRFDDLRDLIFLDPVHEVSEAGWPMQVKDGV